MCVLPLSGNFSRLYIPALAFQRFFGYAKINILILFMPDLIRDPRS